MLIAVFVVSTGAHAQTTRVLWWNGSEHQPPVFTSEHRKAMADYLDAYQGGGVFNVTYQYSMRGGDLAAHLGANRYDIVILDFANLRQRLNAGDLGAVQQFYAAGSSALIFDGSFSIRNMRHSPETQFPGVNGSSAGLLINQVTALAEAGGGMLIGTDHDQWQANANAITGALLPGARFSGITNPSTDGDFIGETLLSKSVSVVARDLLKHWEAVPNQGEAPVGQFTDFMGRPVTLYSLVETADKPGGGRKRPYVSASLYPGDRKTAIDSEQSQLGNMPTRRGP